MPLGLAKDTLRPAVWLTILCRARSLTHSISSSPRSRHHARRRSSNLRASTTSFVLHKLAMRTQWSAKALQSTPLASSVVPMCRPQEVQAQFHLPANSTRTTTASSTLRSTKSQTTSSKPSSHRRDARAVSWTASAALRPTQARTPAGPLRAMERRRVTPVPTRARLLSRRRSRSRSARRRLLSNRLRINASRVWGRCSAGRVR